MIAVIAGSKKQYDDWLRPWTSQKYRSRFFYVSGVHSVMGQHIKELICIGDWYLKPELCDLEDLIQERMLFNEPKPETIGNKDIQHVLAMKKPEVG